MLSFVRPSGKKEFEGRSKVFSLLYLLFGVSLTLSLTLAQTSCRTQVEAPYLGDQTRFESSRSFTGTNLTSVYERAKQAYRDENFQITEDNLRDRTLTGKRQTPGGFITSTTRFYETESGIRTRIVTLTPRANVNGSRINQSILDLIEFGPLPPRTDY